MKYHDIYARFKELRIDLPPSGTPAAAYKMACQSGSLVYLSGHITKTGGAVWEGRLGASMTNEEERLAARFAAIDLLATQHTHLGGLNRVRQIVRVGSMVNSTPENMEQQLVTTGASELFAEIFGEQGRHARSAFGVAQILLGACAEIELCAEVA